MKKLLICALSFGLVVSCTVEDVDNDISSSDDQETFELYKNLDFAMDDFGRFSERASVELKNANKSSKGSCISVELLVPYQEYPINGFSEYEYYNKVVVNSNESSCRFDDWRGTIEYYVAGALTGKWKDSTVFKNVRGDEGYIFEGYRTANLVENLSNEEVQVYDVVIDGLITEPNGDAYEYTTNRNFVFTDRYTATETLVLEESSSLKGVSQEFFINSKTVDGNPIVFKRECFDGFNFLRYPVQGSQDFSSSFGVNFNVDYGDGTCDKEVTLTSDEGSITFNL
ncbi:hypothetical protein [Aquimarina sp. MMG016]|uniref:hypothetical protein n=1 Tax=Aquimarina sp. MMG016 TaxID=2822690 RepID=UPI001B39D05A|nr:hypothetical protein [Aquimarina sp. MMG016]MBQ4822283.1 hypothetical protein [Aquimarina sp. MMG016]